MDHDFSTNPLCKCGFLLKPRMIYFLGDREKGTMKFWQAKQSNLEVVLTMFVMLDANQQMLSANVSYEYARASIKNKELMLLS